jgi:hypothetical protein
MGRAVGIIFEHTRGDYAGHLGYCVLENEEDYREFHSGRPDLVLRMHGATADDFLWWADQKAKGFPPE